MSHSQSSNNQMDKLQKVVLSLESNDPVKVSNALNYLTQKSMEVSGDSVAQSYLQLDALPFLPTVIGSLLDTINPLGNILFQYPNRLDHPGYTAESVRAISNFNWPRELSSFHRNTDFQLLAQSMDENFYLLTILNILRNCSFEAANEFTISSSSCFLRHLMSSILASLVSANHEGGTIALEAIANIAGRIDMTGKKRLQYMNVLEDLTSVFGNDERSKNTFRMRISHQFSSSSQIEYSITMNILMAVLYHVLHSRATLPHISYILRGLEILYKLAQSPENTLFINNCPHEILDSLVEMLYPSYQRDLPRSYEPTAAGDLDIRNGSLDALQSMSALSVPVMLYIGSVSRCMDMLFHIATATSYFTAPSPIPVSSANPNPNLGSSGSLNANTSAVGYPGAPISSNPVAGDGSSTSAAGSAGSNNSNLSGGTSIRIAGISGRILSNNHSIIAKVVEGSQKAGQILSILLTQPEFSEKFRSMRTDLYIAACSDDSIAEIVCNKLYSAQSTIFFNRDQQMKQAGFIPTTGLPGL